jgi:hypothetical protein
MADAGRRAALVTWHDEGMRDWEILSIVASAANNIRHPLPEGDEWTQEQIETHRAGFDLIEDTALSPDLFTDEFLLANRQAYRIVYLTGWHLVVPYASPDLKAIEDFLIERYGMRSDDVDHADLFGWPP